MEGDDGGSQAGDHAVGAVNEERDMRKREGVALSMRPLYHTAATPTPLPPQSLPLRRMLCSLGIQHSRRSQLSREGSACGGASSGGFAVGGGRAAVPLPQSKAANGRLPADNGSGCCDEEIEGPLQVGKRDCCPCGECCVRREFSTPGEVSFPARAAHAVGRVVGGLGGWEGAGLRYRHGNRMVEYRHLLLEAGCKIWVVPNGGERS